MNRMSWIITITVILCGAGLGGHEGTAAAMSSSSSSQAAAESAVYGSGQSGQLHFQTVNGLSLTDDMKTVFEMKGQPLSIVKDDILPSLKTYKFEDCSITLVDGSIEYLVVPAAAGKLDIDGELLPMEIARLEEKLGAPYFISEDGIVYKDGDKALKLYIDTASGKITSVHYFHEALQ